MSTKNLLDRLESARSTAKPRPASDPKAVETRPSDVRVGTGVVRRRAPSAPAEPPPPPPPAAAARTVIRRPGTRPEEPVARPAAPAPAPTTLRRPGQPTTPPPAQPVARVEPVRPPVVEEHAAPEVVAEPTPVLAVEPAAVEAPVEPISVEPTVDAPAEPEPVEVSPPVAAEPVAEPAADPSATVDSPTVEAAPAAPAAPAPEPTMERAVIIERPGGPVRAAGAPPVNRPSARGLPDVPILPGLGRAVVSLPAGYDPTDPTGAKRRAREQASTQPKWGPGARPAHPAAPVPAPAGDDRGDRKKGRRTERSEHSMADLGGARGRAKKGKGKDLGRTAQPQKVVKRKIRIDGEMTVANLAHEMGVKAPELVKVLMQLGTPATMNQLIDFETASIVAQELGHEVFNVAFQESEHLIQAEDEEHSDLPVRPPVVTVMGHVDHGKTTLLDAIRKTKVAAGEAGGITQHIGAYQVRRGEKAITFLDTPGHAAFSAMRARGAKATDIVILVVAADDGVMPQTVEAINHAKAADVPIIVAVNKVDKPGINPESIRRGLMQHGLVPEEYGGDTIFVNVSALKGTGIDDLLDNLLIVAEVEDLRANADRHAEGVVLESRLETGRGAVADLLVQNGTLRQGDILVIGNTWGRVRAMSDDTGKKVKEAGPSTPVEIFGLQDFPQAGAEFTVVGSEKDARTLAEHRADSARAGQLAQRTRLTVDDLYKLGGAANPIQHVVLKTDVGGTLEALKGALEAIQVPGTQIKILHAGIGPITESDVNLAAANTALIVAFNVKADAKARTAADQYGVEIQRYEIIYNVIDEVTARLQGLLAPVYEEKKVGEAEVRALFSIPKLGNIAGCMVLDGKIVRGGAVKVMREGKVVAEGKVTSLKRFKEDVKEVEKGFECGVGVDGFPGIAVGDVVQVFAKVEVPRAAAT